MKLKSIKIMSSNYQINEVEKIDYERTTIGKIYYQEEKIEIDKSLTENLKIETLIHEVLHGILEKLGYDDLNDDEQKVQSIASTLYLVLKENNIISF